MTSRMRTTVSRFVLREAVALVFDWLRTKDLTCKASGWSLAGSRSSSQGIVVASLTPVLTFTRKVER